MQQLPRRVASRAHRILKRLENYQSLFGAADEDIPNNISGIALAPGEQLIGVYYNMPDERREPIVVTSEGLHVLSKEGWQRVEYRQMRDVGPPVDEEKTQVMSLSITLQDGNTFALPVKGGRGNFRDAWSFLRFLMRVLGDVSKGQ